MADFRYATFFSMRSNADYFQLNILMAGDYVHGRKKEITTWHDLETLVIAIKEVGGMAVFVPPMMSGEMDNSRGILALKDYVDQGQGWSRSTSPVRNGTYSSLLA